MFRDPSLVSAEGRDFEVIRALPRPGAAALRKARDRFLVQGGLHGDEVMTTAFVKWLARRYARGESLLNSFPHDEVEIDFLPSANPDGGVHEVRYNARGVNLNRNFGVLWGFSRENPGLSKFSEPETRAIQRLFKERAYLAAVDVHGFIDWIVAPSRPEELAGLESAVSPRRKALYRAWYGRLEQELSLMPGYTLKTAGSLGDGGAFEDWAFWEQGTFAFCMELESMRRFTGQDHGSVLEMVPKGGDANVDLFKRYEAFIYRMFQHARTLRRGVL